MNGSNSSCGSSICALSSNQTASEICIDYTEDTTCVSSGVITTFAKGFM